MITTQCSDAYQSCNSDPLTVQKIGLTVALVEFKGGSLGPLLGPTVSCNIFQGRKDWVSWDDLGRLGTVVFSPALCL